MPALALVLPALAADPFPAAALDPALAARIEVARTLVAYDIVAWLTSDAVTAAGPTEGLGRAWFVLDAGDGPTGWYGHYDPGADRWVPALAFRMEPDQTVLPVPPTLAAAVADPRARALAHAWEHGFPRSLTRLGTYGVNPNLYVLEADGGLDVWVLPSLAPDGELVTATCAVQHYDPEGRTLLGVEVERRKPRVLTAGAESRATLSSVSRQSPTVCELFWAWYYADDFAYLGIRAGTTELSFHDVEGIGRVPVVTGR